MSRQSRKRNGQNIDQTTTKLPNSDEFNKKTAEEVKWLRWEVRIALAMALFAMVTWVFDRVFPASRLFMPSLIVSVDETLLSDSRLLSVMITNTGNEPASNVVVTVESYQPNVVLDDEARREHTHVIPSLKYELAIQKRKLILILDAKIGPKQKVLVYMDRLAPQPEQPGLFTASVTYDRGQAQMTNSVTPLLQLSSEDYIKALIGRMNR